MRKREPTAGVRGPRGFTRRGENGGRAMSDLDGTDETETAAAAAVGQDEEGPGLHIPVDDISEEEIQNDLLDMHSRDRPESIGNSDPPQAGVSMPHEALGDMDGGGQGVDQFNFANTNWQHVGGGMSGPVIGRGGPRHHTDTMPRIHKTPHIHKTPRIHKTSHPDDVSHTGGDLRELDVEDNQQGHDFKESYFSPHAFSEGDHSTGEKHGTESSRVSASREGEAGGRKQSQSERYKDPPLGGNTSLLLPHLPRAPPWVGRGALKDMVNSLREQAAHYSSSWSDPAETPSADPSVAISDAAGRGRKETTTLAMSGDGNNREKDKIPVDKHQNIRSEIFAPKGRGINNRNKGDWRTRTGIKSRTRKKGGFEESGDALANNSSLTSTRLDESAVSAMHQFDDARHVNDTIYDIVDQGHDKVDLNITHSSWLDRIHGHRQMVIAGAAIAGVGLLIIIFAIIAMILNRRASRRSLQGRSRSYRRLGSGTERAHLHTHGHSLFPLSSEEEEEEESDEES